jgi:hypothetical protein
MQSQKYSRMFTASELAEFEYCPLAWWHEHYEPWAQADSEDLFARLVELEHEYGPRAPGLPEYHLIEQLLLRLGAFEEGRFQHAEHAEAVADLEEEIEREQIQRSRTRPRGLRYVFVALVLLAALLLALAFLAR